MAGLQLSLLGPFAAALDDQPISSFRTRATQALLIYLACQPDQVHRREHLMTLLWPGLPQKSAQANLRQTLYQLKQAIPETAARDGGDPVPLLLSDWQTIQINPEASLGVDILVFKSTLREEESSWPAAAELYRGDFLADFYLPDSEAFEEWVLARRQELRGRALKALEALAEQALKDGELEAAEAYARQELAIDNLREGAHRRLMTALALNGRRTEALAQYEELARLLEEELGVEPSVDSRALREQLRSDKFQRPVDSQKAVSAVDEGAQAEPAPARPKHNLPALLTPFIGREAELAELEKLMADTRLVTIAALGGMGKTRLALAFAERQLAGDDGEPRFQDGVFFVSLAPISEAEHIIPTLAEALSFQLQGQDSRSPKQQILDYLAKKHILLVMDNFEHLLTGADLLTTILQTAPGVAILVTSRERLKLSGEQLVTLGGLGVSADTSREALEASPAVQLFERAASRVRPDFELEEGDDPTHLAEVCRLVGGMPLGLELAAGWVEMLPLADIAAEIRGSLDFLETETGSGDDRQRSMRAIFNATWDRLEPVERDIFSGLSIFRGGFTRQSAQDVTGASLRALARLVGKSLLSYQREQDRYQIHELLRQFGAEKLAQDGDRELTVRDRHCAHFCELLENRWEDLKGPRQLEAVAEIEAEFENCRGAWQRAAAAGHLTRLAQASDGLGTFLFHWRGRFEEGEQLFGQAAEALSENGSLDEFQLLIKILSWQASFSAELGRLRQADQLSQKCLGLLDQGKINKLENWPGKSSTLQKLAWQVWKIDWVRARELCQESLSLAREDNDRWEEANALRSLADMARLQGDFDEGERLCNESLVLSRTVGDRLGIAIGLERKADYVFYRRNNEEAEKLTQESLNISQELGLRANKARCLELLFWACFMKGQFERALSMNKRALDIQEDMGLCAAIALNWWRSSMTETALGRYAQAHSLAERSLAAARELHDELLIALSFEALGRLALAQTDFVQGDRYFQESATIFRTIGGTGQPHELAILLCESAMALTGLGQTASARQQLTEALEIFRKTQRWGSSHSAVAAALLFLERGEVERAAEWYALVGHESSLASSHWIEDIAGRHIAAAAASLPPEVVSAAEERGRARDLESAADDLLAELKESDLNAR